MPHLIIGDTTDESVRLWVRGDKKNTSCKVSLTPAVGDPKPLTLLPERDYTGTIDVAGLHPDTVYAVTAKFERADAVCGRVRTMQKLPSHRPHSFSFILSSCNLSVVSINNFLALLAATAGTSLANTSLDLPRFRRFNWLRLILRWLLRRLLGGVAIAINAVTGLKQPGPPYVRSPFIKLSAVFESWVLEIETGPATAEQSEATGADDWFLAVGDRVSSAGDCVSSAGAVGLVASTEVVSLPAVPKGTAGGNGRGDPDRRPAPGKCLVVLTQVQGEFKAGDVLHRMAAANSQANEKRLGTVTRVDRGLPWYSPPAFFLHAGDQIYFDFPDPARKPTEAAYRLAYREAWFEDGPLCHLLAHWPHYMTLDDHELADQFATDFIPPNKDFKNTDYLEAGIAAYADYAHALSPARPGGKPTPKPGPFWYAFQKGCANFFVLDTRTRRRDRESADGEPVQMIDEDQMRGLLQWMTTYRRDLKFIVTSVPFVAEVDESASDKKKDWFKGASYPGDRHSSDSGGAAKDPDPAPTRNSEQDKWSADRFRRQRDQIIEHIAENGIERLVFLTGDMHCCYHATLRIGRAGKKYESITVHELAGGPVNQLQLANVKEFNRNRAKCTSNLGVEYQVRLERFHGDVSAVMHVKVDYVERDEVTTPRRVLVPEVEWNVIRTLTDPGPQGWAVPDDAVAANPPQNLRGQSGESVMAGRIAFVKPRSPGQLDPWPPAGAGTRSL